MYHFIVNPNSRSGLGRSVWARLESILKARQISYQVYFTNHPRHATEYARSITADNEEHILVALGGDGTVNEVINGISDFSKTIFGYIPVGSGNDFARSIGISRKPSEALETVLKQEYITSMDVASLTFAGKKSNFAVSAGLGFDAAVCEQVDGSRLKPFLNSIGLGKLSYVGVALRLIFTSQPERITLTLDNREPVVFPKGLFAVIMNHRYEGGGFKFCPRALYNDHKLDILVVSGISRLKTLMLLPTALFGAHTRFHGVYSYRCRKAAIQTEHPLALHMDGESLEHQNHILAACESSQLQVILPGKPSNL